MFLKHKSNRAETLHTPALDNNHDTHKELKGHPITHIEPSFPKQIDQTQTIANQPALLQSIVHDPTPHLEHIDKPIPKIITENQELYELKNLHKYHGSGRQLANEVKGYTDTALKFVPYGHHIASGINSMYDPLMNHHFAEETAGNMLTHSFNQQVGGLTKQDVKDNEELLVGALQTAGLTTVLGAIHSIPIIGNLTGKFAHSMAISMVGAEKTEMAMKLLGF